MLSSVAVAIVGLSALIWVYFLVGRAGFWRSDQVVDRAGNLDHWPNVVAVIPARDEVKTIGQTVTSLLAQNYAGAFDIIVVDDNSTDGTATAAGQSPRLKTISAKPLQAGWTGKLWAVKQGLDVVDEFYPDAAYVLLTDADITHDPDNLRELMFKAETAGLHLASLMVKLRCQTFWERMLIPAFVFFFQKLYPFSWVNDPTNKTAAAAGGCMLIRLDCLRSVGGIEPIRDRLIDDCAMAALLKAQGPIWLGLSSRTTSSRAYSQLSEIWQMVARTAFVQLDHSPVKLLGTVLAMVLVYLVPPTGVVLGLLMTKPVFLVLGLVGWGIMSLIYMPTLKLYSRPLITSVSLPMVAFLYTLMTVCSAYRHWFGRGSDWKGRRYPK